MAYKEYSVCLDSLKFRRSYLSSNWSKVKNKIFLSYLVIKICLHHSNIMTLSSTLAKTYVQKKSDKFLVCKCSFRGILRITILGKINLSVFLRPKNIEMSHWDNCSNIEEWILNVKMGGLLRKRTCTRRQICIITNSRDHNISNLTIICSI